MRIEILYPELGIYYGDYGNIAYLQKCLPEAQFISTPNIEQPLFVREKVDMVYLGSLSESHQLTAIERLRPYRDVLMQRVKENVIFLFTGNAMEILGNYIQTQDGEKIECLGLYDFYSERNTSNRLNYLFLGDYQDIRIVGNKSQYSQCYMNCNLPFITVEKGLADNFNSKTEGIHDHNLFATYLLGPFLVLNPLFTERLIRMIAPDSELFCRNDIMLAYEDRLSKMENPAIICNLGH